MVDVAGRTEPYRSLKRNFDQAFLLAAVIRRGGLATTTEIVSGGDQLSQRVVGTNLEEIAAMTDEEKELVNELASMQDTEQMEGVAQQAQEIARLAQETAPQVLFLHMITIFEAYLEDLLVLICRQNPMLITASERELALEKTGKLAKLRAGNIDVEERAHNLLRERWDHLGVAVLERALDLHFTVVCSAAGTTPQELDRAKAVRNIHIHNSGRIDKAFLNRVRDPTLREGNTYLITSEYLIEAKDKLYLVALGVDLAAAAKYPAIAPVVK